MADHLAQEIERTMARGRRRTGQGWTRGVLLLVVLGISLVLVVLSLRP